MAMTMPFLLTGGYEHNFGVSEKNSGHFDR